jgi:hypothetical protein
MTSDDTHAASLAYMTSRFVDLYASVKGGRLADANVVLYQARVLDAGMEAWEQQRPPLWKFTEIPSNNTVYIFRNKIHQYHNFWIARMLNNYRWVRILINNLILFHLPNPSLDRISSLSTISCLSTEICHSVSFFLEPYIIEEGQAAPFPVLAGYFVLIFPLAVAGCAVGVVDEIHDWIVGVLENISMRRGIASALFLVGKVRKLREEWRLFGEVATGEVEATHPELNGSMETNMHSMII